MKFSHVRHRKIKERIGGISYYPDQLTAIYGFPSGLTGQGKTVAVIELGGGFVQRDLDTYFQSRSLSVKPVIFVSVDGATNSPSTPDSADGEVMLDLEVIGGVAPDCQLRCYIAPNTDQGFIDAINQAIADKVDCISISWGGPEDQWLAASRVAMDAAFQAAISAGIIVTAAAGDNGSSDGTSSNAVDYPASSPYVVGCGGTTLISNPLVETVWNDGTVGGATGGGISAIYSKPSWQVGTPSSSFRCSPDVAAVADPETGINVLVDGQSLVIGGTSAVAPFMAGLFACLKQSYTISNVFQLIYGASFRDITVGNNGTYVAKVGYDCCTGVGVPIGTAMASYLSSPVTPPPPPPPPPPGSTITIPALPVFGYQGNQVGITGQADVPVSLSISSNKKPNFTYEPFGNNYVAFGEAVTQDNTGSDSKGGLLTKVEKDVQQIPGWLVKIYTTIMTNKAAIVLLAGLLYAHYRIPIFDPIKVDQTLTEVKTGVDTVKKDIDSNKTAIGEVKKDLGAVKADVYAPPLPPAIPKDLPKAVEGPKTKVSHVSFVTEPNPSKDLVDTLTNLAKWTNDIKLSGYHVLSTDQASVASIAKELPAIVLQDDQGNLIAQTKLINEDQAKKFIKSY